MSELLRTTPEAAAHRAVPTGVVSLSICPLLFTRDLSGLN
jgi:hypothetical protein